MGFLSDESRLDLHQSGRRSQSLGDVKTTMLESPVTTYKGFQRSDFHRSPNSHDAVQIHGRMFHPESLDTWLAWTPPTSRRTTWVVTCACETEKLQLQHEDVVPHSLEISTLVMGINTIVFIFAHLPSTSYLKYLHVLRWPMWDIVSQGHLLANHQRSLQGLSWGSR